MNFNEMLKKSVEEKDSEKGLPNMSKAEMISNPWRHVELQVNKPVNVYEHEKAGNEGTVSDGSKKESYDGDSGAYDEDNAPARKDVDDDGEDGSFDKSDESVVNAVQGEEIVDGIKN